MFPQSLILNVAFNSLLLIMIYKNLNYAETKNDLNSYIFFDILDIASFIFIHVHSV